MVKLLKLFKLLKLSKLLKLLKWFKLLKNCLKYEDFELGGLGS